MERLIQQRAGSGKSKLLEKGMKTPSSLVIDLLTSISNCFYSVTIHKEGCLSSPWRQKLLVLSHVPPSLELSIWSISTNLSYFFCLLLATGLVGFKWNLLHNLFHFDNGMQYVHRGILTILISRNQLEILSSDWYLSILWKTHEQMNARRFGIT